MSGRMRAAPRDWGQASRVVAQAYFPHELRPVSGAHEPRLTLRTLDLGPVLIGHVGWGADVAIECDYPSAYEVNMPITGHLESRGRFGDLRLQRAHADLTTDLREPLRRRPPAQVRHLPVGRPALTGSS